MATKKRNGTTGTGTDLSTEQVQEVVKRKRNRPDLAKFGEEYTEPGDNSRFVREARIAFDGGMNRKPLPPIDISDPEQVKRRISEYLDFCELNDKKPSMVAMANWIGVSRETLNTWKRGEYRSETHSDTIKKACLLMEELWVDYMQNGKVNPGAGIFLGKNMFGYKDVADVVVTPNNPYQAASEEELKDKYLTDIPSDDE